MSRQRVSEKLDVFRDIAQMAMEAGVFVSGKGVFYPVLRVIGLGDFRYEGDKTVWVSPDGGQVRDATGQEASELDAALERDQASLVVLARPGFGSGYKDVRPVLKVLHAASGNGWRVPAAAGD